MRPIMIAALFIATLSQGCKVACSIETPDETAVPGADYALLEAMAFCEGVASERGLILDETPIAADGSVTCVMHAPLCEECELGQYNPGHAAPQGYVTAHMGTRGVQ